MSQTYVPVGLRRLVRERAGERCEYCLIPERVSFSPHWIDHIIAEKHGGKTESDNLCLACVLCNQHKGSDLSSWDSETDAITRLFNPRLDQWSDHFRMVGSRIDPLTTVGRATVRLLQFNSAERIQERDLLLAAGILPTQ